MTNSRLADPQRLTKDISSRASGLAQQHPASYLLEVPF
jgi:hypothetical protein